MLSQTSAAVVSSFVLLSLAQKASASLIHTYHILPDCSDAPVFPPSSILTHRNCRQQSSTGLWATTSCTATTAAMEFFAESTCSENAETPAEGLRAWGNGWVDADTSFTWPIGTCRPSGDTRAPYVVQTCSTSGSTPPSSVDTEATTTSFTPVTISGQLQYVTSSTYANDPTCTLSDSFVSHEMYPQGACLYDPDFSSYGVVTCEEDGRVTMRHFSDRSCRNEMQVDVGVRVGAGRVPDGDGAECLADGFGTYTKVVCEGKLTEGNLLNVQGRVPRRGLMV